MLTPESLELLKQWAEQKDKLATICAPIVAEEMRLRKLVFAIAFPSPVEGTNDVDIPNGWKIKGTYKLDRKLDEAALPIALAELRKQNVVTETLIRYKPEIETKAYKALSDANRMILEQAMTIKPASPTLELIPPKGAAK